jgi:hypothetical protein
MHEPERQPLHEPEPEPELEPSAAPPPLSAAHAAVRAKMSAAERALVADNADPASYCTADELLAALGLTDTKHDWAVKLCSAKDVRHTGVADAQLTGAECAALRTAVDADAARGHDTTQPHMAIESDDTWLDEQIEGATSGRNFTQLVLTRTALTEIVGAAAVERLMALSPESDGGDSGTAAATQHSPPWEPLAIFARRYAAVDGCPWCPFHFDVSSHTVNVALSDDSAHKGGRLLVVFDGRIHRLERREGCATVHPSSLLHAVSRMTAGVRYSLLILFGEVCPHSSHRLELTDGSEMRRLYPDIEGSYHCDECDENAPSLGYAPMWHCPHGCEYCLCASCADRLLDDDTKAHTKTED